MGPSQGDSVKQAQVYDPASGQNLSTDQWAALNQKKLDAYNTSRNAEIERINGTQGRNATILTDMFNNSKSFPGSVI